MDSSVPVLPVLPVVGSSFNFRTLLDFCSGRRRALAISLSPRMTDQCIATVNSSGIGMEATLLELFELFCSSFSLVASDSSNDKADVLCLQMEETISKLFIRTASNTVT